MSGYTSKPTLLGLPAEVKVEIIKSLASGHELDALGATCRTFRDVIKGLVNEDARLQILLRGKLGHLLNTLAAIRAFDRSDDVQRVVKPAELQTKAQKAEYIKELTSYRTTARWFRNRFFSAVAEKFGDPVPDTTDTTTAATPKIFMPSEGEKRRMEESYLLVRLHIELTFMEENCQRRLEELSDFDDFDEPPFMDEYHHNLQAVQDLLNSEDLNVMYCAARVMGSLLEPAVLRYVESLSGEEIIEIGDEIGCMDLYNKFAIADKILFDLGRDFVTAGYETCFDWYHKILTSDPDEQLEVVKGWYPIGRDIRRRPRTHRVHKYEYYEPKFLALIADTWRSKGDRVGEKFDLIIGRPVWKEPGSIFRKNLPPWYQDDTFDIEATFCDDERLERLGYFRPGFVDIADFPQLAQPRKFHEAIVSKGCDCKREWWCTNKFEIWLRKNPYASERGAPGWEINRKRRNNVGGLATWVPGLSG
ncbi:hypothetical protein TWF481_007416 [Arthrobotrys musiformis]|uniref:F-box domain-containing protein n=1 Tax=Arthrobotrys musiformis TaxID=47236 RepID=A0AAV9WDC0_9PEZI